MNLDEIIDKYISMLPRDNNVYTWNEVKTLLKADIEKYIDDIINKENSEIYTDDYIDYVNSIQKI